MSVRIRLTRMGRKKIPYYRVVVADSRSPRDGRFIERLGFYHPLRKDDKEKFKVDEEKALLWLSRGAQPSETVRSIFSKLGIMKKFHETRQRQRKVREVSGEQTAPEVSP